jgi:hypothetical protein
LAFSEFANGFSYVHYPENMSTIVLIVTCNKFARGVKAFRISSLLFAFSNPSLVSIRSALSSAERLLVLEFKTVDIFSINFSLELFNIFLQLKSGDYFSLVKSIYQDRSQ